MLTETPLQLERQTCRECGAQYIGLHTLAACIANLKATIVWQSIEIARLGSMVRQAQSWDPHDTETKA